MNKWRKSPVWLIDTFYESLPKHKKVERRKMFGYPCAFVNGNMFTGLHQENMIIRLDEKERLKVMEQYNAGTFEPVPGRVMKEYVSLPEDVLINKTVLRQLVSKSLNYAIELPRKTMKKKTIVNSKTKK